MWIDKLDNGKFKYVERYYDHEGRQKFVSKTLKSNSAQAWKQAQKILDQKIEEKLAVTVDNVESLTFKELADEWLKLKKKTLKASTHSLYSRTMDQINIHIGDITLDELSAGKINRTFIKWFDEDLVYTTVQERYKLIKNVIKFGIAYEYIEEDLITGKLTLEKINVSEKREDKYLEPEEADKLFEDLTEAGYEEMADFFTLLMQTGMRFGELAGLHIQDIDLEAHTIYIRFTYDKANKLFTLPKNNKTRLININSDTVKLIKKVLRRRKLLLMAYGVRGNNLLFFRENNTPMDIFVCTRILHKFEEPEKPLTTHIFRHTFITRMVEQYVPATLIAEHVGHSDTQMIERVYNHFSDKMEEDLKTAINAIKF